MTKLKPRTFSKRSEKLTPEEFASLKEVGNRPMKRTISDAHRDRLIAAGYIREIPRNSHDIYALELTGRGLARLAAGK